MGFQLRVDTVVKYHARHTGREGKIKIRQGAPKPKLCWA